jgi:hypothetical protein
MDRASVVAAMGPKVKVKVIDRVAQSSPDEVVFNMGFAEGATREHESGRTLPSTRVRQVCPTQCWIETLRFSPSKAAQFNILFVGPDRDSLRVGMISVNLSGALGTAPPRGRATIFPSLEVANSRGAFSDERFYLTADGAYTVYRVGSTETIRVQRVLKK